MVLLRIASTLAAAGCCTIGSTAFASDTTFTIANQTGIDIESIYASPAHEPEFPAEPLPGSSIPAGASAMFTIANGACAYDLRFVFIDGQERGDSADFCECGVYAVRR